MTCIKCNQEIDENDTSNHDYDSHGHPCHLVCPEGQGEAAAGGTPVSASPSCSAASASVAADNAGDTSSRSAQWSGRAVKAAKNACKSLNSVAKYFRGVCADIAGGCHQGGQEFTRARFYQETAENLEAISADLNASLPPLQHDDQPAVAGQAESETPTSKAENHPFPCPFCGNKFPTVNNDVYTKPQEQTHISYWGYCIACAAEGPWAETQEEAIEKWNKRAWPNLNSLPPDAERALARNAEMSHTAPTTTP